MPDTVTRPIIIVGTHRSGTTFLGEVFAKHPDVAFWDEPRHVWAYGHNFRPDDVLTARDATPGIARHIRRTFAKFQEQTGKARFAEKTPSNCLKLPFINAVFPDALFIHIYRDGRGVVRSTAEVNQGAPDKEWIWKRLTGTAIWEWPALVPRAARTFGRKIFGKDMAYWGPCPPGWKQWAANDPKHIMLAKQWRYTIEPVLAFRETIDKSRWIDMAYEEFVKDARAHTTRLLQFAGLPIAEEPLKFVETNVDPTRKEKWRQQLGEQALEEMRPILEGTIARLGYAW